MSQLSDRILSIIQQKNISYSELSAMTRIPKSALQRYATGSTEKIPLDRVEAICRALGVGTAWMLGWDSDPAEAAQDVVSIRFLGSVAAGYHHLANEEYEYLNVPQDWLNRRPASDYFAMRVEGSSMYPMFCEGDEILCLSTNDLGGSGHVGVIIYNGGEATLKKIEYVPGGDWIDLVPINPMYQRVRIAGTDLEQCRIIGRVIRLIRTIE